MGVRVGVETEEGLGESEEGLGESGGGVGEIDEATELGLGDKAVSAPVNGEENRPLLTP